MQISCLLATTILSSVALETNTHCMGAQYTFVIKNFNFLFKGSDDLHCCKHSRLVCCLRKNQ